MKLLSLHITAFGGLSDREMTFSDGVTEILDKNGAGKSTLAAFIKTMLYGLEGSARSSAEENEYRLYEPWQGGRFGGSLTLTHRDMTLRIERFYERVGKTKTPQMTLRVTDLATGLPTDILGDEPGRTLLGVDGPSFLRTAYLSSRGVLAGKTVDISAKLGGSEGEEADMAQLERALKLLKSKRNEIRTTKKQQNGQKLLDCAERELLALEAQITEAEAAREGVTRESAEKRKAEEDLEAITSRLFALQEQQKSEEKAAARAEADRHRIEEAEAAVKKLAEGIAPLADLFPLGPPSERQEERMADEAAEYRRLKDALRHTEADGEDPLPTAVELSELHNAVTKREEARIAANLPPAEETAPRKAPVRPLPFLVGGALLAVLGAVLLFLYPLLAIPAIAASIGLFATALLFGRRRRREAEEQRRAEEARTAKKTAADEHYRAAKEEATRLLLRFGLTAEAGEEELYALQERAMAARLAAKQRKEQAEAAAEILERLNAALGQYRGLPDTEDPTPRIRALRENAAALRTAREALCRKEEELSDLKKRIPSERPDGEKREEAALLAKIEACEAERARLGNEAAVHREREASYRKIAEGLTSLLDRRLQKRAEIAEYEARLVTLDRTADLLEEAREAYEARYLGGIRRHIGRYTERLLQSKVGTAQVDLDLSLSFLDGGEAHGVHYLSTGLRAIADICLRLSLTDALYPGDPPPLILDDPFVALDDENLGTALSLLRELGKERQILYLTCHQTRSIP